MSRVAIEYVLYRKCIHRKRTLTKIYTEMVATFYWNNEAREKQVKFL